MSSHLTSRDNELDIPGMGFHQRRRPGCCHQEHIHEVRVSGNQAGVRTQNVLTRRAAGVKGEGVDEPVLITGIS